ncbi:hypothetical protein [Ruegeria sp. HKCCA4008]|uniref:hypothetical protein n=1 Tax=Ruegeria sp. HKCCA4008 TaxID=2682999 RepID=UPI001488E486|nr:hypothetical protein [Ruegeria sp. HKCCA4008]
MNKDEKLSHEVPELRIVEQEVWEKVQGLDVELIGDIESLFVPPSSNRHALGVETMVPGAEYII